MSKGDQLIDRGADRLQELADRAATDGGTLGRFADQLADDAAFLRKLKPSLVRARIRGEAPIDEQPGSGVVAPARLAAPAATGTPQSGAGPNPFLVVGASFAAGILLAKVVDWRGHAHPRD